MRARLSPRSWFSALAALALAGGLVGACTITNTNHCAYTGNAGACGSGLICDQCASANNGCVALEDLTDDSCLYKGSASTSESTSTSMATTMTTTTTESTTTIEPTTTTTMTSEATTSTTTMTTEPTTSTTEPDPDLPPGFMCNPQVPASAECFQINPDKPYCVADDNCGDCLELSAKTCADIDPNTPACADGGGLCVECTAENLKACGPNQICNQYINDCGPCFEHEQCKSGACNLDMGTCFPDNGVIWVEDDGVCAGADGTEAKPYCGIDVPLNLMANAGKNLVIKIKPGIAPYEAPLIIKDGVTIFLLGVTEKDSDPLPVISDPNSQNPLVTITGNSSLYVDRLAIDGSSKVVSATVKCTGSTLWIDRSSVSKNANPINSDGCKLTLRRSVVATNTGGSNVNSGSFTVINSFITGNAGAVLGAPFRVNANVELVNTTILGNSGIASTGITCTSNNPATVRNSVLLGQPMAISGCIVGDQEGTYFGTPSEINTLFQGPSGGVYRPKPAADAISSLGVWHSGDPYTDYFGDLRPGVEAASDFAGAAYP